MPTTLFIHHVTLMVDDLQAAAAFYHRELGLQPFAVADLDYPGAFFQINDQQQLHLAEFPDSRSFRGHCCLRVANFAAVYRRMRELDIIDLLPWGKIRILPNGSFQMYVRDPANNLVELTSEPTERDNIDPAIFGKDFLNLPYRSGRNEGRTYQP